jgi:formylmethanofuran dehydrogenase subunit E
MSKELQDKLDAAARVLTPVLHKILNEEKENTIACWRCEEQTPMSEMIAVYAEWVCGVCYDDL